MRLFITAAIMLICGSLTAMADKPPPAGPVSPFGNIPLPEPTIEARLDVVEQELHDLDNRRVEVAQADDLTAINQLTQDLARLSEIEVDLLDMRRLIAANLATPGLILFENADGSIYGRTREEARNEASREYDSILARAGPQGIVSLFPPDRRMEAELAIQSGFGSPLYVDFEMAEARANQQELRLRETSRLTRTDSLLAYTEAVAAEIVFTRDRLIWLRDSGGSGGTGGTGGGGIGGGNGSGSAACNATAQPPNANICLYQSFPLTGYAHLLGFGVSPDAEYPLRGNYVCVTNSAFWVVEGSTMRHFICDTANSCRETRCLAINSSTPTGGASTRYVLAGGAVMETERAQ